METGYLNFHDEEHFSDFSLSLEQNLVEKPHDLLMHMVENDFDYMETHLDIANSDSLWSNGYECSEEVDKMVLSDIPTISKLNNVKEDFAKVLTDWQEHIGYLQSSDMDEYMDIIGLNLNSAEKKSVSISETTHQESRVHTQNNDTKMIRTTESDRSITKHSFKKGFHQDNENILQLENGTKQTENEIDKKLYNVYNTKHDDNKIETVSRTRQCQNIEPKYSGNINKIKKSISKYDNTETDITIHTLTKQKRKKKEKYIHQNKSISNNCNDESYLHEFPVLQAGDVKSLLEQFEASENTIIQTSLPIKINKENEPNSCIMSTKIQQSTEQPSDINTNKPTSEIMNLHKNIRHALPKEVIEKIKMSGRKRMISIIPAIRSTQNDGGSSNGTRMQDAAVKLSRNKLLKIVTNNTKSRTISGGLIQLDHDYCSSTNSSINSSDSNSEHERLSSDIEKTLLGKDDVWQSSQPYVPCTKQVSILCTDKTFESKEYLTEGSSRKDSGLESGEVSDNNDEQSAVTIPNVVQVNESTRQLQNKVRKYNKETLSQQENCQYTENKCSNNTGSITMKQVQNDSVNSSTHEMKIRSALATNILQLQKGILDKTKSLTTGNQKIKQMVSVLKKPSNIQQSILTTTSKESIITITNSLNETVQNIIVQDIEKNTVESEEKKPPRKKLNLAEYRSRREQNRSDNSRTNSPIQPMILVYVHHASTTTEPIKDDPENLLWSEREIVSVLKPKLDIDEQKLRPKPATCDVGIQTYETVFEFPPKPIDDVDAENEEQRGRQIQNESQRAYRRHKISSSSSRSRSRSETESTSRSRSRSKSRSRSRSRSRSSNRSRSHKRSTTRHRRISHRRSSVSSSSSWSSRSRSRSHSNTRSTLSSGSRYSRSRSRSSRSKSRSSSRYSSCSRSSSRSNFGRNKWSIRRRKGRRYRRSYDKYYDRHRSTSSYHGLKDWRRSPLHSYRKSYENWYDKEKQRQVEERRVIYVGRLDEGITKADLRRRFETFGPVVDISVHFREHGDNYGFVTFAYKNDAYEAVEHGNDDPALPRYDLCFGGRRAFCKVKYADLDGMASNSPNSGHIPHLSEDNTFDLLLKEAKAKLRKRKV